MFALRSVARSHDDVCSVGRERACGLEPKPGRAARHEHALALEVATVQQLVRRRFASVHGHAHFPAAGWLMPVTIPQASIANSDRDGWGARAKKKAREFPGLRKQA